MDTVTNESENPTSYNYSPPVDKLLTYGSALDLMKKGSEWPNYLELGFGPEHIPDLIRMANDEELNQALSDSLEVWAPIHAWRTLGQMRAEAAIEGLLPMFENKFDTDWAMDELPDVYAMIGAAAIPVLAAYLADISHPADGHLTAVSCLVKMAEMKPESRDQCIDVLSHQLEQARDNDPAVNGFIISAFIDLEATEKAPSIKRAFASKNVDLNVVGDWNDAQVELGLKPDEDGFKPNSTCALLNSSIESGGPEASVAASKTEHKAPANQKKAKQKLAKQARKKNRKR